MLPEFNVNIDNKVVEIIQQPSKDFKDNINSISGFVDGKSAIEQTVRHILSTERYSYVIYPDNYGMEFEKYIGKSFQYFQATIENDLKSALTQDDRIADVKVTNMEQLNVDSALVEFDVYTTEGIIEMGANFGL